LPFVEAESDQGAAAAFQQQKENTRLFIENHLINTLTKCNLTIEDSDSEDN